MAAPKGNQYAKGCTTSGRPREVTDDPEDLIKLGKELVLWARSLKQWKAFPCFYCLEKDYIEDEWDLIKRKKEFIPYYEKARTILSDLLLRDNLKEGYAHRFLRIYCPEVKKDEDELVKLKKELTNKEQAQQPIRLEIVNYSSTPPKD